jgi:hypothetical protein
VPKLKSTTPSPGVDRGEERVVALLEGGQFQEGGRGLRRRRCWRVDKSMTEAEVFVGGAAGGWTSP